MAGRIKGITIEINGDTKGLDKALSSVNSSANKTQNELRDVNKLLKLDPGNTELVAQKQKLLSQAITQTGDKLKTLKDAQAQVDSQFAKGDIGEEQYRAFQREIASTEATLKGYKSQLSTAENSQQELSQSTKRLETFFKATGTEIDDFKSVIGTRLVNAIKNGTASSESMDKALQMIAKESGVASSDMSKLTQTLDKVDDGKIKEASKSIEDLGEKTEESSGKMNVFKGAVMVEGLRQISDKAGEAGGAVIETAMDFGNAQTSMQNTMGLTATQAKNATDVVKTVFKSGMVDSVDEANESVQTIINSFGDLANGGELQKLSTDLTGIAKHGGVDIKDAANASSQAMKSMGLTGQQATDLIAKGLQDGLNKNDDFLDTVNEYSPTFKDAGISADGMLSVLNTGMQNGAFNTDKVADAVKEFQLRLTSGQLDEPMKQFSKSTQDAFAQFKAGKATSADVMASVGKDLSSMPADKAKAAVQGLGTQFEDLGQKASSSLLEATKKTEDATGATKKMNEQTPGEKWVSALNTLKESFSDVVIQMTPLINKLSDLVTWFNNLNPSIKAVVGIIGGVAAAIAVFSPVISAIVGIIQLAGIGMIGAFAGIIGVLAVVSVAIYDFFNKTSAGQKVWKQLGDFFNSTIIPLFNQLKSVVGDAMNGAANTMSGAGSKIAQVIKNIVKTISDNWGTISSVIGLAMDAVNAVISQGVQLWQQAIFPIVKSIVQFIGDNWNDISNIILTIMAAIGVVIAAAMFVWQQAIFPAILSIAKTVSLVFGNILNAISGILGIISGVINLFMALITGNWKGAWDAILQIMDASWKLVANVVMAGINIVVGVMQAGWELIKNAVTAVWNVIVAILSGVWNVIKAIFTSVLGFITAFIQAEVTGWQIIIIAVMNIIMAVISGIWNGIKAVISGVVNAISSVISSVWNVIVSITSSTFNAISSVAGSVWNGISSVISGVVNGISSTISGVWNGIVSITSSVWNGIKNAITGPMNTARDVISGIINAIKGFFSFSISWPHIPMPSFSITPAGWEIGDLLKGKIPSLGISWHAAGGIFTKPTLFSSNGGMHGVGEAGPEAVMPLNKKTLAGIGKGIADTMGNSGNTFSINIYPTNDMSQSGINQMANQMVEAIKNDLLLKKNVSNMVGTTLARGTN